MVVAAAVAAAAVSGVGRHSCDCPWIVPLVVLVAALAAAAA
jgi:hypothetical protein